MNCNTPTDIIFSFQGFTKRAGIVDNHIDGWGIAFFDNRGFQHFIDHRSAVDSELANFIKSYPIKSKNIISHIRKATQGPVLLENCHPFVRELWGKYWIFAHNGEIKNFNRDLLSGRFLPVGDTDSELVFCWLMQEIANTFSFYPTLDLLSSKLQELADFISRYGRFNFILLNESSLFAYATTDLYYLERHHPFSYAKLKDDDLSIDFSKCTTPNDKCTIIVTDPLTINENWNKCINHKLYVFQEGSLNKIENL